MEPTTVKISIDDGKGQVRDFYLKDDLSLEALIVLMNRLKVPKAVWEEQQQKREYERARYHQQQYHYYASYPNGHNPFESFFRENYGQTYPGEPKADTKRNKDKIKLAQMAGIDWSEARDMDEKKLLKRAQRRCHPDTGGSHDAWLNLQKLQTQMGL